ncbi:hypothetical protein N1851_021602 [Merluccius polli]|uniref:DDE Tnp4 domain-containing protein n=1 Tax=Merluccius polli TaxID=89951 RepID=A0AA47MJE6_MERPO|nr:hypothetical protein N1851_021602 [Merluccius polli]
MAARRNVLETMEDCELIKRYLNREGIKLVVELFIRFPLDNQQLHRRIKANFMACRYAGVVGAIDGTHIQIIAPSKDEDVFVNRNERSAYDPHILMGSGLRQLFERHLVPVGCHLLGDSGYPCKTS